MEITASAYRHNIEAADMLHAWNNALRIVPQVYDGKDQLLVLGPSRNGALLEIVVPCDEPQRIIHADKMRAKFLRYLR